MSVEDILGQAKEAVRKVVPDQVEITHIDLEGPVVVLYTKNMDVFADNNDLVRQLAQSMRRRVMIRPDPSLLSRQEDAERIIKELIPPEAQITNINFEDETGEVTIEALSPGLVIGKQGSILNDIKKKIGWSPKVSRTPPIPSKTVEDVRQYLRSVQVSNPAFAFKQLFTG